MVDISPPPPWTERSARALTSASGNEQAGQFPRVRLPSARGPRGQMSKVPGHVRLVVEAANDRDVAQRAIVADQPQGRLQPDDAREGLRREPDGVVELALELPRPESGEVRKRVD